MIGIGEGLQRLLLILGKGGYPLEIAPPYTRLRCDARGAYGRLRQRVAAGVNGQQERRCHTCFAPKPIAATKIAMRATQQPQRGGTTSCASRPSAGIDRAKCLK